MSIESLDPISKKKQEIEKKTQDSEKKPISLNGFSFQSLIPALPLIVAVALMAILYQNALLWWKYEWTQEGSYYAHGIFIPFFVALMIYRDKERLVRLPLKRSWVGIVMVVFAILMVLAAWYATVPVTLSISFIIMLIGSTLFLAGKHVTKALLFPMLFLFTMIPLVPDQLINPIAFPIQMTSAKMAATVCNLIGFPAVRTGTAINMEHYTCNVELPCSGFKTLIGLMAFSAAFGYLVVAKKSKRWGLFLVSPPLAILVNGIRITMIALVGELWGFEPAHAFHDWSGFIVLILGFMFLFSFARLIKCDSFLGIPLQDPPPVEPTLDESGNPIVIKLTEEEIKQREADFDEKERLAKEQMIAEMNQTYGMPRQGSLKFLAKGVYLIGALLLLGVVAKANIHPPKLTYPPVNAADVPTVLGKEWEIFGKDIPIAPEVKSAINPAAWLDRDYVKLGVGSRVNLLLSAGNGRKVFHDPHTCFLGTGYYMHDVDIETIQTDAGPVTVQVTEAEDPNHNRSYVMFLYVVGGQQKQTTQQINTSLIWQTLAGDGGRPSYFIRFRHQEIGVTPQRKEELKDFIRAIWKQIGVPVMKGKPADPNAKPQIG